MKQMHVPVLPEKDEEDNDDNIFLHTTLDTAKEIQKDPELINKIKSISRGSSEAYLKKSLSTGKVSIFASNQKFHPLKGFKFPNEHLELSFSPERNIEFARRLGARDKKKRKRHGLGFATGAALGGLVVGGGALALNKNVRKGAARVVESIKQATNLNSKASTGSEEKEAVADLANHFLGTQKGGTKLKTATQRNSLNQLDNLASMFGDEHAKQAAERARQVVADAEEAAKVAKKADRSAKLKAYLTQNKLAEDGPVKSWNKLGTANTSRKMYKEETGRYYRARKDVASRIQDPAKKKDYLSRFYDGAKKSMDGRRKEVQYIRDTRSLRGVIRDKAQRKQVIGFSRGYGDIQFNASRCTRLRAALFN